MNQDKEYRYLIHRLKDEPFDLAVFYCIEFPRIYSRFLLRYLFPVPPRYRPIRFMVIHALSLAFVWLVYPPAAYNEMISTSVLALATTASVNQLTPG